MKVSLFFGEHKLQKLKRLEIDIFPSESIESWICDFYRKRNLLLLKRLINILLCAAIMVTVAACSSDDLPLADLVDHTEHVVEHVVEHELPDLQRLSA